MPPSAWLSCLLIIKYFVNRGTGNTEQAGDIRCASPFTVECKHAVPVDGTPAAKPDVFQFRFLSAFIGAFQYPTPFSLRDGRQDGNYHLTHVAVST